MTITDPRQRFPDLSMTEEEAQAIMQCETECGFQFSSRQAVRIALSLERAKDEDELNAMIRLLEKEWGIQIEART